MTVKCRCGAPALLKTPDYGYGYGAEFVCSESYRKHGFNEYRFSSNQLSGAAREEALLESSRSRASSAANAAKWAEEMAQSSLAVEVEEASREPNQEGP